MICCVCCVDSPVSSSRDRSPPPVPSAANTDNAGQSALSAPSSILAHMRSLRLEEVVHFDLPAAAASDSVAVVEAPTVEELRSQGLSEGLIRKYMNLTIPTMHGNPDELKRLEAHYKRDWVRVQMIIRALPPLDPKSITAPSRTP